MKKVDVYVVFGLGLMLTGGSFLQGGYSIIGAFCLIAAVIVGMRSIVLGTRS